VASLTTIYQPRSFTVTASTSTTRPGTSTTRPKSGGSSTPTTHTTPGSTPSSVTVPPGRGTPTTPSDHAADTTIPGGGTAAPRSGRSHSTRATTGATNHGGRAASASLDEADLGSLAPSKGGDGLGWFAGLLVLALLIAVPGAVFSIWRARREREAADAERP
jgi:hypothetical protein